MLGHHDVGSEDWLQRRRKSPPVCETHLTAGKQGVERLGGGKLWPCLFYLSSLSWPHLAVSPKCQYMWMTALTTLKNDKRKQQNESVVPPNGHRWAVQVVFHGEKKKIRGTAPMVLGHVACQHAGRATNGTEVFVSVSPLCVGATTLIIKHCIPFHSTRLRTRGGLEANSSALHREWGIELCCGVIRQPSGPSLSLALAPLSLWWGSRWSSVAG